MKPHPAPAAALLAALALATPASAAGAGPPEPLGIAMEGYPYPFPVRFLDLRLEGQDLRLAYMDVPAQGTPNGRTVLLLHGKNFYGAYWEGTIRFLAARGFRVVVPDEIGFGKSSKPDLHYSFEMMAQTTRRLLERLGVEKVAVVGHSMGGMLATRFALMYPQVVTQLVLENPIGLEDYREKVPYTPIEANYRNALAATEEGLDRFYRSYFAGWKEEYGEFARVAYRWTLGGEYPRLALSSALTYEMIYTQPVVHDFPRLAVSTLLVIGQADRTTVGRGSLPREVLETLGRYPELGRRTAAAIPGSRLVEIAGVGHIPHLEAPERFHAALADFLR